MAKSFNSDTNLWVFAIVLLTAVGATLAALTSPDGSSTKVKGQHHSTTVRMGTDTTLEEGEEHRDEQEGLSHRLGQCQLDVAENKVCEDVCFPNDGRCVNEDRHHSTAHCACIVGVVRNDPCMDVNTQHRCTHDLNGDEDLMCFCQKQECDCRLTEGAYVGHFIPALQMSEMVSYDSLCKQGDAYQNACPNGMVGYCLPPMDISTLMHLQYHCLITSGEHTGFITLLQANVCLVMKAARTRTQWSSWQCTMDETLNMEKVCLKECPHGTTGHYVDGNIEKGQSPVCKCVVPPVRKNFPELLTVDKAIERFSVVNKDRGLVRQKPQEQKVSCAVNAKIMDLTACKVWCTGLKVCECKKVRVKHSDHDVTQCKCVNVVKHFFKKISPLKLLKRKQKSAAENRH